MVHSNVFLVQHGVTNGGKCWASNGTYTGPAGVPVYGTDNISFLSVAIFPSAVDNGSGAGDVFGPGGSVNNNFVSFQGSTGKLLKDSGLNPSSFLQAANNPY